jgi:protein SCO1/2
MRLGYLMIFILITAVMGFAIFQPIKVLPRLTLAPGYSFVNQEGKRFTSESLRGSLVLYTFSHSQCTSPCILTSATLASLRSELTDVPTGDIPLQFVTIFVNPEQTTPTALQAQADRLGVYTNDWHLVTGDSAQLKHVIGSGFSTYYAQDANGSFTVDPVFVLVDGWGIIRAVYRTAAPDVAIIKRDLRLVAQEVLKSTGVNRVAYEAAHLFLCYPQS